ncbi:MAG: hypothetical protein LBC59_07370 [Chitinispirillales bacterium]|jgi:hypothetical protein|nr:hypothetical protein [Chitinispirillales bacterium]
MNFLKNYLKTLFLTTLLTFSTFYCSACSGKGNNPANSSGGDIVCAEGEAWIIDGTEGGYIFTSGGDMIAVAAISDGRWYGTTVGTYTTNGNNLTTITNEGTKTTTYNVSGDKLTLTGEGDPVALTKRTDVYVNV